MKVLTAYRRYTDQGETQGSFHRWNTFEHAYKDDENYERIELHYGSKPGCIKNSEELNKALLNTEFDIAIVNEEKNLFVNLDTAKKLGKKLFIVHGDCTSIMSNDLTVNFRLSVKQSRPLINHPVPLIEFAQYCNILVADYGYGELLPNFYAMTFPLDPDLYFYDKSLNKDIEVSHNGNMFIGERHNFADIFKKANLNIVYTRTPRDGEIHSEQDYSSFYKRSKISLCFNQSIFGPQWRQRKSRIYEIVSCGSLLLMTHPEVLKHKNGSWFTEGVHFESINKENCVDKIRYYLSNDDARNNMIESAHQEYLKLCGPKVWWDRIISLASSR
jgi:hypothetical protein